MPRRRLCRIDRPVSRLLGLLSAMALSLSAAVGCNLLLDNDKRVLRSSILPSPDAGNEPDAGPSIVPDAGQDASARGADAGTVDTGEPDAGRAPAGCPGTGRIPECSPGTPDTDDAKCGLCDRGKMERNRTCNADCTWGEWSEWGRCLDFPNACKPGEVEGEMTGPCGDCNSGKGTRTRTCTIACGWTDWSPIVCTPDPLRCTPGTVEMLEPIACSGMCSSRTPTRKCNDACSWDDPNPGQCTAQGVCMPGATRMTAVGCNPDVCNKGEGQQMETCNASCMWGSPVPIGMCPIPSNVCRPVDLGGKGWRCRPNDPGFREHCNASTTREAVRCTWNGARDSHDEC
jgi:hypothetical protein